MKIRLVELYAKLGSINIAKFRLKTLTLFESNVRRRVDTGRVHTRRMRFFEFFSFYRIHVVVSNGRGLFSVFVREHHEQSSQINKFYFIGVSTRRKE